MQLIKTEIQYNTNQKSTPQLRVRTSNKKNYKMWKIEKDKQKINYRNKYKFQTKMQKHQKKQTKKTNIEPSTNYKPR